MNDTSWAGSSDALKDRIRTRYRHIDRHSAPYIRNAANLPIAENRVSDPAEIVLPARAKWQIVNGADVERMTDIKRVISKVRRIVVRVSAPRLRRSADRLGRGPRFIGTGSNTEAFCQAVLRVEGQTVRQTACQRQLK